MYFPILRGRQFELLALRECVNNGILSDFLIPIVEPVKVSSTFTKTLDSFVDHKHPIGVIRNPVVGKWSREIVKTSNQKIQKHYTELLDNKYLIETFYVTPDLGSNGVLWENKILQFEKSILICNQPEYVEHYEHITSGISPLYNIIPDRADFRRSIRANRVMCEDHFPKQSRNIDYSGIDTEFFSADHLYYKEDGYKGFSDYSVVGSEYSETGFAPYAVAIHIVYFDDNNKLRIAHFVSDSNDDISDPARKFGEAVEKLVQWNKIMKLNTMGIKAFEDTYKNGTYPGLGVAKKYSIMHHLELMSVYLNEVEK